MRLIAGLDGRVSREHHAFTHPTPGLLEGALTALYDSYARSYAAWEGSGAKEYGEPAPVFIVVCNNTTVSKMVYDYISGWEKSLSDYQSVWVLQPYAITVNAAIDLAKLISPFPAETTLL